MTTQPYYSDEWVTLYHGDSLELLPRLGLCPDLIVTDPPYGETALTWDRWPTNWPSLLIEYTDALAMWCFGSMRMFLDRRDDFAGWRLSQDVVWEKHNGSGYATDRFRRVHEHATHWYRGSWTAIRHETPTTNDAVARSVKQRGSTPHLGLIGARQTMYETVDGGPRLMRSVLYARSQNGAAINETEKPIPILTPLIEYGCPPGGIVFDPFAGSCSTLIAAHLSSRHSVGIELREQQCEVAAKRLSQGVLDFGVA